MEKIHITVPVIVEGKYDRARLAEVTDAPVFTTDGFGVFNQPEKLALFRRIGKSGVILLCDSDGAGSVIRRYLHSALPPECVYDLFTPQIAGKERRKRRASRAGFLGVEGLDATTLRDLFARLLERHPECAADHTSPYTPENRTDRYVTKADLYEWGLNGRPDASAARDRFCKHADLPAGMTANALLAAINMLYTREDAEKIARIQPDCHESAITESQ